MLSSESTIRKLTYQKINNLKTESDFFSRKYLKQKPSKFQYYMIWKLRNLIYYMLAMVSHTQKVWTVGFRSLIKQLKFYHSWLCVETPSIMVPWHMLQIQESTIHIIFVVCVVLIEAIFPCFNLKPDDCNLAFSTQTFLIT